MEIRIDGMKNFPVSYICRNFNLRGGQSRIAWELGSRYSSEGGDVHFVGRRLKALEEKGGAFHCHRVFQPPRVFGGWFRFRSFAASSSNKAEKIVATNGGVVHGFGDSYRQDILTLGNVDWAYPKYIPGRVPEKAAVFVKSVALRDPRLRALVLVSNQMKKDVMDYFPDFDENRIKVIYPGVDTERFKKYDRYFSKNYVSNNFGIPQGKLWILFAAGGDFEKRNIKTAIQALEGMQARPEWVLVILGGDKEIPPLPRELETRTFRLGHVQDVSMILPAFDLLVYPAWYDEYSLMVAESMASGLPVITSTTVGAREVFPVEYRDETIITNPGDVDALRKRIKIFIENGDLRKKVGENNRKSIQITSWDNIFQKYKEIYREFFQSRMKPTK